MWEKVIKGGKLTRNWYISANIHVHEQESEAEKISKKKKKEKNKVKFEFVLHVTLLNTLFMVLRVFVGR